MDAYIVLHGLMLLTCHQSTPTCDLLIANTPPRVYQAGFIGSMTPLPDAAGASRESFVEDFRARKARLVQRRGATGALYTRSLVLNGSVESGVPSNARYTLLGFPAPDEVWAADYVIVNKNIAVGASPVQNAFKRNVSGPTIKIAETFVLHYTGVRDDVLFIAGPGGVTYNSGTVKDIREQK